MKKEKMRKENTTTDSGWNHSNSTPKTNYDIDIGPITEKEQLLKQTGTQTKRKYNKIFFGHWNLKQHIK